MTLLIRIGQGNFIVIHLKVVRTAIGGLVVEAFVSEFLLMFSFERCFRVFPAMPMALWIWLIVLLPADDSNVPRIAGTICNIVLSELGC
jgi:hypothetical protein